MKAVLSVVGKFHIFPLAEQLYRANSLVELFTGYPRFKLKNQPIPQSLIHTFPFYQTIYMGIGNMKEKWPWLERELAWLAHEELDKYVAKHLPEADLFHALSCSGSHSGREAKSRGMSYICDRGSTHIEYQKDILEEEYRFQNIEFRGLDPRKVAKELEEYELADRITVPSQCVYDSFIQKGVAENKLVKNPYGVNLGKFKQVGQPPADTFEVLFVGHISVRKGIYYLLEAFKRFAHSAKRLTLVGSVAREAEPILARYHDLNMRRIGSVAQDELTSYYSASHVMVLPSLEEGLALVQAEALACGCPVIGTINTGLEDLIQDSGAGVVVGVRDVDAITSALTELADNPDKRLAMSSAALNRVNSIGGWDTYGENMISMMTRVIGRK